MKKVYSDATSALAGLLHDNMTVAAGGFGLSGIPENLIQALVASGAQGLTIVGNNAGVDDFGMGLLLKSHQVKKVIASYVGENKEFERQVLAGELELQLTPQGTLAEKLRAGGAGIPGFYTRTAFGTKLAEGKPTMAFDGKAYVLEEAIHADLSIVKAWKGDPSGNLVYRKTSRNFNPMIATGGKITVAEVEQLVKTGELDPDQIHTPGIYVDRIIQGGHYEKRIEFRTVAGGAASKKDSPIRELMARRAARELRDGYYVNLGIGIPTLVANFIPQDISVTLQSENGLLGIGPFPAENQVDPDLINAGQADDHQFARVELFFQRRLVRDDTRRAHRSVDSRRAGGCRQRRSRQLDGSGQDGQGSGRGDGPGVRREESDRADGAQRQGRLAEDTQSLHAAGYRQGRGQHDHHRLVRVRRRRRQRPGADRVASWGHRR
jgi:3-oxoacid CoA-transferase